MNTLTQIKVASTRTRVAMTALLALSLLAMNTEANAKLHKATECSMYVSDFSSNGQPLSYEAIARLPRVTLIASTGTVYVRATLPNGREAIYAVERNGCARKTNLLSGTVR